METIFDVNKFNLWYGNTHALHNVNMVIHEHDITALIGPSGCGKSTFIRTLNRMNDLIPEVKLEGSIKYRGQELVNSDVNVSKLRKDVGMVFQKPNPFAMSIYDNVAYGPRTHGVRNRAKLDEIVERSLRQAAIFDEVKDRLKTSALGLSGGQQQRTAIGRAVIKNPDILLCDEPTGALDYRTSQDILQLICDINEKFGNTIIMVTHNESIKYIANHIFVLHDGRIKEDYINTNRKRVNEVDW